MNVHISIQEQFADWIHRIASIRFLPAKHCILGHIDAAEIVCCRRDISQSCNLIAFQAKTIHKFLRLFLFQVARLYVTLVGGIQELIHTAKRNGKSIPFDLNNQMRKPEALQGFMETLCPFIRNLSADALNFQQLTFPLFRRARLLCQAFCFIGITFRIQSDCLADNQNAFVKAPFIQASRLCVIQHF